MKRKDLIKYAAAGVITLLLVVAMALGHEARAQEGSEAKEEVSPSLVLSYLCTSNDTVLLNARLQFRKERNFIALQNATIAFSIMAGEKTLDLGTVKTDSTGTALCFVPLTQDIPSDADGLITYQASFKGEENYLEATESISAKPAKITVEFYEEDSIRYIRVTATQKDSKGVDIPVPGETVKLYTPSLFRPLPIGEISLDDQGTGTMEFPVTVIGDSTGKVVVSAMIEEHDLFGMVRGTGLSEWAVPKHLIPAERPTRELWTPVAPIWMIITLIIMLAGVWAHYVYAVVQLVKIKRLAKKERS